MIIICEKCEKEFEDVNYIPSLPLAKRIYCDECLDKLWKEFIKNLKNGI